MPFKSEAQARYMFSQHPDIAKEFAKKTESIKDLPEHVKEPPSNERRMDAMKSLIGEGK
jgi:hypothetical protein